MNAKQAIELYPDLLVPSGMEGSLIGVVERCGTGPVALINKEFVISSYMCDGMSRDEAEEFFELNTLGAWVGDQTPVFLIEKIEGKKANENSVHRNRKQQSHKMLHGRAKRRQRGGRRKYRHWSA